MQFGKQLRNVILIFVSTALLGVFGYRLIEGWSWVDSFYMAIITVSTVGFGEIEPLSQAGRVFTTVLIILGLFGITYALRTVTDFVVAGELGGYLEE